MAKPSSAHSDDPAPAPTRSTRQTRSQSAEPGQPSKQASNTRGAQKTSGIGLPARKRQMKVPTNMAVPAPGLETVEEDAEIDAEAEKAQLEAQLHEDPPIEDDSSRRVSRQSAFSGISGTTAKTSFSQDELAQMDPDVMIDLLPSFAAASDDLARLLLPNGKDTPLETFKEIRRAGSKKHKLYTNRLTSINVHKPHFGSEEYIRPSLILRGILGVEDAKALPNAAWRPDNIIYKINLDQMVRVLLVQCDPSNWDILSTDALARLAAAFPEVVAGTGYHSAALEFWLNLAGQLTIADLEAHSEADQDFNPEAVIDNTFYDEEGAFRHLEALHLDSAAKPAREQGLAWVENLVKELKKPFINFSGINATAAIGRLKVQFRWETFRGHVMRYYEARSAQVNDRIDEAGGVAHISKELAVESERRVNAKYAEKARKDFKVNSTPRKSLGGQDPIAALKRRESRLAEQQTTFENQTPPQATAGFSAMQNTNKSPELQSHASPGVRSKQAQHLRHAKSFLDPQPNARRVPTNFEGDDTQPSPRPLPPAGFVRNEPATSSAKRVYAEIEEQEDIPDPTQDEGFQVDGRDFADADERRKKVAYSTKPTFKARPSGRVAEAGPSFSASLPARFSPGERQRTNPGSSLPAPLLAPDIDDGELPASSLYARAKIQAKLNRVPVRSKDPRIRQPWTEAEENAVIELIEEHGDGGISYAALKAIDRDGEQTLYRRTQEDIRFKARNMKLTFLKAGGMLPENFDQVFLDKKAIDQLRQRGIHYTQEQQRRTAMPIDSDD